MSGKMFRTDVGDISGLSPMPSFAIQEKVSGNQQALQELNFSDERRSGFSSNTKAGLEVRTWELGVRSSQGSFPLFPTPHSRFPSLSPFPISSQFPIPDFKLPPHSCLVAECGEHQQDLPPLPPLRWFRFARWFRLGIGIFLLLGVLLTSVGCTSAMSLTPWQDATKVASVSVLQSVVAADTSLDPKTAYKDVQAWVANGRNASLAVFDYHNTGVCGVLGCLYSAYVIKKNTIPTRVFSAYFDPALPPNYALFAVADSKFEELPCIQVNQSHDQALRQLSYCYNGKSYQLAQSNILDLKSNAGSKVEPTPKPTSATNKKRH